MNNQVNPIFPPFLNVLSGYSPETFTEVEIARNKKPDIFLNVYHNNDFAWEERDNCYNQAFVDADSLKISKVELCLSEDSYKKRTFEFKSLPKKYQKEILYELCAQLEALNTRNDD